METEIDMNVLTLADLEELSREYRLGKEAQARMEQEAKDAYEQEQRMRILDLAKAKLPECLRDLAVFDSYDEGHRWAPRVLINAGEWRVMVHLVSHNLGQTMPIWELNNYPFEVVLPVAVDCEDGWFVWWRGVGECCVDLIDAISKAMIHDPLNEIRAHVEQCNAGRAKKAIKEPVYLPADQPEEPGLMDNLYTFTKHVVREVLEENHLV